MPKDASAIFHSQVGGTTGELERLSALETLKGLKNPDAVSLGDLVHFLDSRGLWRQFAKITLGDLLEDELGDAYAEKAEQDTKAKAEPVDGGMDTEEFARLVMPFVEGNGDVTLDDIEDYSRLDRKVLRHHLGALVKEGRLERIGVGRHAVYSSAL
jgi:hypothetical protein